MPHPQVVQQRTIQPCPCARLEEGKLDDPGMEHYWKNWLKGSDESAQAWMRAHVGEVFDRICMRWKVGMAVAARTPTMATTIINSISVKPPDLWGDSIMSLPFRHRVIV